jgi:hypothetical protein
LENSIRYARRFVGLVWHPRLHASGLINAFFGFRKKSKKATSREPLIKLRIMAHCAFDSRATVWTGS